MAAKKRDPFFIGWRARVPLPLAAFLVIVAGLMIGLAGGVAFSVSATVNDPGAGGFEWGLGEQKLTGIISARPYPVLYVPREDGSGVRGVLLSGFGKRGVQADADPLDGKKVDVSGFLIKRGSIDMIQVGGAIGLRAAEGAEDTALAVPEPTALGRWRLVGEICDGKCYLGAMRPGIGLAHKACANLCLIGGVPPVFVSAGTIDGERFFLLADAEGAPLPDRVHDLTALQVELEGEVERRGSLLVFKTDLATAKVLR